MDILAVPAGSISSGSVAVTNVTGMGTGVQTALQQPATGTGSPVLATSPSLTTPDLGTPSAVNLTNGTALPIGTGVSGLGAGVVAALEADVTGSGSIVLSTSPALIAPALDTPSAGVLTNCTGLPVSSGLAGTGTGVAGALAANVTGSGGIVLATSPTLNSPTMTTPNLGTPSAVTLTHGTGLPIGGLTGLGTGVATALAGGVVGIVASVSFGPLSANNPQSTIYTVPAGLSGWYLVVFSGVVVTPASGGTPSSTLPNSTIFWTDARSSGTPSANVGATNGGNTTNASSQGMIFVYAKAGTTITASTSSYATAGTVSMAYDANYVIMYVGA